MYALRKFLPVLVLMLGCLAGCTTPIAGKNDEVSDYPTITITQEKLQRSLGFQPAIVARVDNNLLQVTQPIRAKDNHELLIEYKVIWFDIIGQPIPPETSWVPMRLEPRQPMSFTVRSTSEDAVKYNIQIRWARP